MATRPDNIRDQRVVVLMSASEKRKLSRRASQAQMNLSEYVRSAASGYDATGASKDLMQNLLDDLQAAKNRLADTLAKFSEYENSRPEFDEKKCKADYIASFESDGSIDWDAVARNLGFMS